MGPALAIPTAIMSFAMTSIFVCLLVARSWSAVTVVVVAVSAGAVVLLKLLGLGSLSVLLGALAGVAGGMLAEAVGRRGGAS